MGEVRGEKELRLELTKMRNPYLEEEFGNAARGQKRNISQSRLQADGRFAEAKAYPKTGGRSRERLAEEQAYPRKSRQGGRGRAEANARTRDLGQNGRGRAKTDMYSPYAEQSARIRVETRLRLQTEEQGGRRVELSRERQKRLKQLRRRRMLSVVLIGSFATVCLFWWLTSLFIHKGGVPVHADSIVSAGDGVSVPQEKMQVKPLPQKPEWTEDYLTPNEYSRPGEPLPRVDNIFVHYTANKETSAAQNRSYFENLKDTHERYASAHFIIGYEGEILQVIPLNEIACAVQSRNYDSISIECCYLAEDGHFTEATYESLIELLAYLLQVYNLEPEDILRHYDSSGKKCPLYYTEHEDAWDKLKEDVAAKLAAE